MILVAARDQPVSLTVKYATCLVCGQGLHNLLVMPTATVDAIPGSGALLTDILMVVLALQC